MSVTDSAAAGLPPTAAEHLPDDVATLKRMVLELLASLHEERHDNEALRHRIHLLLQRLYGPRGERFDPDQPLLFPELAAGQDTHSADRTGRGTETQAALPAPRPPPPAGEPATRAPASRVGRGRTRLSGLRPGAHRHRHGPERTTRLPAGVVVRHRALRPQVRLPLLQSDRRNPRGGKRIRLRSPSQCRRGKRNPSRRRRRQP